MRGYAPIGERCAFLLCALVLAPVCVQAREDAPREKKDGAPIVSGKQAQPMAKNTFPTLLTVDEAVRIGLERNPLTAAGLAGIASSAASYRALAAFPSVQLGVTRVQGTSSAPSLTGETSDTIMDVSETLDT